MKTVLMSAAALTAMTLAGAASAAEVEIKDAVARVVIIPENRADIDVTISGGSAEIPRLQVRRTGAGNVEIDGDLERINDCRTGRDHVSPIRPSADVEVDAGRRDIRLADAPLVTIRTPMDVSVKADGAVFGSIGRSGSVKLRNAGCGDWTVANVDRDLEVSIAGSGDVRAGSSSRLDVNTAGSGDVEATVSRSLEVSIAGSGGVRLQRLNGALDANIAGSGDVTVNGGRATVIDANIAGSGSVAFGGEADRVSLSVMGSGDVRVRKVNGDVKKRVMGSGDIIIGS
jgi:hypothetical protein